MIDHYDSHLLIGQLKYCYVQQKLGAVNIITSTNFNDTKLKNKLFLTYSFILVQMYVKLNNSKSKINCS